MTKAFAVRMKRNCAIGLRKFQKLKRKVKQMYELIKENWPAFYILGLSILTAIGKLVIRKWVWKR